MEKIVFVCLGNICRSPMAEFVMKDLVEKEGKNFEVESRATSSWEHGNPIHPGTRALLTAYGIPFDATKGSQQISQEDFQYFDQIIAMDELNKENLEKMAPADQKHKIKMLLNKSVPDPWYTGDFEETYRLVKEGCLNILENNGK
ncbi:low molecular weight phosphotyrosine protein phosphatase [Lactococcus garvieae subsp. garvieae]|uniref:low molecular weight protein-tyrosine-phosphatase n=1 Tax=Lactococcus garvieae TaxID=1363 RepID=UPI0005A6793F|nr:low molecular weight protein-tyrosine-phosphatase [Lactococcus garvieae]KAA8710214.1 low molecular weight phosphotyrosine protein phosphatase [Lactococcus garvieae subsp. garvieae]MDG6191760.1 low molecular weight phosphotyrosine protein phosphatase [Lactococcus garvieae]QPR49326.1 low molecular weight phosphotyrosine protein phosphatase [Lactococcus garvieae]